MKAKILIITVFFSWFSAFLFAQTDYIIQPGPAEGKDAQLRYQFQDTPSPDQIDFKAIRWTCMGIPCGSRGVIEFDLSVIPSGSQVNSAYLSLYHHPLSGDVGHSTLSGSNSCWLRRITTPWVEDSITWNTRPSVTTQNQIVLPVSANDTMDYIDIDVSALVQDMLDHPDSSYGFMMQLQTEVHYRSLLFASSDHPDSTHWPKLQINASPAPPLIPTMGEWSTFLFTMLSVIIGMMFIYNLRIQRT